MVQILETVTATGLPEILSLDSFTPAADQAVRTATLTLDPTGTAPRCGDDVTLSLSGELVLTGYIRDVRRSHGDKDRSLSVSICSRTVDATECSCDLDGGEFDDQTLDKIAKNADKLGIGIISDGDMPAFKRHKVIATETLYSTLERRARSSGIHISDTPKGKLKLTSKPEGRHSGGLIQGQNIKSANATETEEGRFSKVKVRGQLPRGSKPKDLRAEGSATDSGVRRNRPAIIQQDGEATVSELKARAERTVREAAGNSVSASITTVGWRDAAGKLWTPNYLVYVKDDYLEIDGDMLIKSVTFSQNGNDGTKAVINLVDPRAMGGENPRGKTSKAYAAPTDTATSFTEEE